MRRFVVRVAGRDLPPVEKSLRVRCSLHADDHAAVGVSVAIVALGTDTACAELVELVYDPLAAAVSPPRSFELVADLVPAVPSGAPLTGALQPGPTCDGTEVRVRGAVDPDRSRTVLPELVLRGTYVPSAAASSAAVPSA